MYVQYSKRILDILICIAGLPVFVILLLIFGFLIKLEDRGVVFYKAERVGKDGKLFPMYKFRSMKVGAPFLQNPDGSAYNGKDDSRVTKIGKFMRETSIDETPQIWNVLKGDMSIVGPRPSLSSALITYRCDEVDKMKVKPGITGYTQAYYRNTLSNREKRLIDSWYANNVVFWLDVKIFLKTIIMVLKREGLYTTISTQEAAAEESKDLINIEIGQKSII